MNQKQRFSSEPMMGTKIGSYRGFSQPSSKHSELPISSTLVGFVRAMETVRLVRAQLHQETLAYCPCNLSAASQ